MQSKKGRVTRFLEKCARLGQCEYDERSQLYVFYLSCIPFHSEETLMVYPKERRVHFFATEEYYIGETLDGTGGYSSDYGTETVEDDDRKNLSSRQAAKMLYRYISKRDVEHRVSKRSLRLLLK